MTAIDKLLNPMPEVQTSDSEFEPRPQGRASRKHSFEPQLRKKQKLCKDAAVFVRGPIRGECRYPPHEYQDDVLSAQHQQHEIYPMKEISEYPRHIPYNSEKKSFLDKTGRESLEVFQYCFKIPGEQTTYSMLWDYNIGLVRTTPLFKCMGHSKTTPAKMLNRNPGLREICHSITGGALVAQGYWMPYEAAKAIAATFCWKIRYALTPVFGVDFLDICIPTTSEQYGDMTISPRIIKECAEQAKQYREMKDESLPQTPPTVPKQTSPSKLISDGLSRSATPSDISSNESCGITSPTSTYSNMWTAANSTRSASRLPFLHELMPKRRQRADDIPRSIVSSPAISPKTRCNDLDEMYEGDHSSDDDHVASGQAQEKMPAEEQAAASLLELWRHADTEHLKRRRASA